MSQHNASEAPMRAEVTFEVSIEHYVYEDDPSPTERDVARAIEAALQGEFDLGAINVTRV